MKSDYQNFILKFESYKNQIFIASSPKAKRFLFAPSTTFIHYSSDLKLQCKIKRKYYRAFK
jgi:hypothetical protein